MTLTLAWKTDPGLQRQENEDSVLAAMARAGGDALLIVCDGMGGHAAGREASTIAIETMAARLDEAKDGGDRDRLLEAFEAANAAVLEAARTVPEWAGMGSTMTALVVRGDRVALLNVGDSPAYVIRGGDVFPIAQDHSWPAEQYRAGLIDASQVKDHPFKHRLTRAVGVWEEVAPYTAEIELEDGDLLVVMSDGVETAGVPTETVRQLLDRDDLQSGVEELVELCRQLGAPDNVTVAVARYEAARARGRVPAAASAAAAAGPSAGAPPARGQAALERVSRKKKGSAGRS